MTDILVDSGSSEADTLSQANMRTLCAWLDAPPLPNASDELTPLLGHLEFLRTSQESPQHCASALGRLYTRSISVCTALLPLLTDVDLPVPLPRKTRQLAHSLQELLQTLAEDLLTTLGRDGNQQNSELSQEQNLTLWRCLNALSKHLLISNLAASPAVNGIWRQLHQIYETVRRQGLEGHVPEEASSSLQNIYFSAILLGCAQPASFTSSEINFIVACAENSVDLIEPTGDAATRTPATFWIDPSRDATALACSRKLPPPDTHVHYFSCDRLAPKLKNQLDLLENGASPQQINLPDFASTPGGQGVLRRLITYWCEPGKRRFPRRRQNYRAALCSGLHSVWHMFQDGDAAAVETSSWMITNESPDGYALMHVSGKTGGISVGDITAIRTESGANWQICMVRWALSENQEHLELGLQILATRAVPAHLARPSETGTTVRLPVLILPEIRALHSTEMLVIPTGTLENQPLKLVLVLEKENLAVREVKSTHLDEQNSHIEIFSIEPDTLPS